MAKETFTGPLIALGGLAGGRAAALAAGVLGRDRPLDLLGRDGDPGDRRTRQQGPDRPWDDPVRVSPPLRSGPSTPRSRRRAPRSDGRGPCGRRHARCLTLATYAAGRAPSAASDRSAAASPRPASRSISGSTPPPSRRRGTLTSSPEPRSATPGAISVGQWICPPEWRRRRRRR